MPDSQFAHELNRSEILVSETRASSSLRGSWLNLLLFLVTVGTTTAFGFAVVLGFRGRQPIDLEWIFSGYAQLVHGNAQVWVGLTFSCPLLLILLAHEFGHYVACRRSGVDASLPFFLPSPTLLGTLGAFIRIRSPIYTRKDLFDIGASGPFAGFVALLPFLIAGVWQSRVVPGIGLQGAFSFGTPLVLRLAELVHFGAVPASDILLSPMAMAAWAGLLATAINLLPMGQLDGGHILYAVLGARWHRILSTVFVGVLIVLGFFYRAWWIWAALMFFFGRRHPLVYDATPLRRGRLISSIGVIVLLLLSLSIVPVAIK